MLCRKELEKVSFVAIGLIEDCKQDRFLAGAKIEILEKSGEVLIVDVYKKGNKDIPNVRFISDGQNFISYIPSEKQWNKKKIESNISYENIGCSHETLKLTRKFLGYDTTGNTYFSSLKYSIDNIIQLSNSKKRDKTIELREQRIAENMNLFQEYPADIREYLEEDVFPKYIFLGKSIKRQKPAICSACEIGRASCRERV